MVLKGLPGLEELDIEENPCCKMFNYKLEIMSCC